MRTGLLIVAVWAMSFALQGRAAAPAPQEASQCGCASATIEEAIEAVDDGYRFDAYIVRWHGSRVLVSAPLGDGGLHAGDNVSFVVGRHKIRELSLLTFNSFDGVRGTTAGSAAPPPLQAGTQVESATLTVQEVLQAEDNGYRHIAYVAQWHGMRVAVTGYLARDAYAAGESIPVEVIHLASNNIKRLSFVLAPDPGARAASDAASQPQDVQDSAIIEDVLDSKLDGVSYSAYIVQWKGARVAVPLAQAPLRHVGESMQLTLTRRRMPVPMSGGTLDFKADVLPPGAGKAQQNVAVSVSQETGVVDTVLSAQDDIYRYRAYVVTWHGARVIVQDAFARTGFKEGDTVAFSAAKYGAAGDEHLSFVLFDFSGLLKTPEKKASPAGQGSGT